MDEMIKLFDSTNRKGQIAMNLDYFIHYMDECEKRNREPTKEELDKYAQFINEEEK